MQDTLNIIPTFINYTIKEGKQSLSLPACFIPHFAAQARPAEQAMQTASLRYSEVNNTDCFCTAAIVSCNALQPISGRFSATELARYAKTMPVNACAPTRVRRVNFTLGQATNTQRGSRGLALYFL